MLYVADSEKLIEGNNVNKYWFYIWANLLIVMSSSKKPASDEQVDGAKHVQFFKAIQTIKS